jgi:hypothetical protein
MRHRLLLAALMLAAASSTAFAGVVITSTQVNLASKEASPISGFFEADRLKIVTPGSTVIFRGDLKKTWVIGTAAHSYVEITPEVVTAFAARIAAAQTPGSPEQAKLQERLAKLPPQQREIAEQQLRGMRAGAAAAQQVAYAKTGQAKAVSAGRCEIYGKSVSGQKQEELCIVPLSAVGLADADFRVLEIFNAFMGPIATSPVAPRADYFNWADMNKAIGFSGIPLESTLLSSGQPALQDTMQKIERVDITADTFDLPDGLTKRELTGLR